MTSAEFCQAGERAFGRRWKAPLARELGLSVVTVWRYATGLSAIPTSVAYYVAARAAHSGGPTPAGRKAG